MRPAAGLGDRCLVCGTADASVLNIVGGDVDGRRVFDTVCDQDMGRCWWVHFHKKHRGRVCRCEEGAYLGAQKAGTPTRCERCSGLVDDEAAALLDRIHAEALARLKERRP